MHPDIAKYPDLAARYRVEVMQAKRALSCGNCNTQAIEDKYVTLSRERTRSFRILPKK
jgi:hypothetical protein